MFEDNNKQKHRRSLTILLGLCIAALACIYFLPSSEPEIRPEMEQAVKAQHSIKTLKGEFDKLNPNVLTSTNYAQAMEAEEKGNEAFSSDGDYEKALPFYNTAIELYQKSIDEAEPYTAPPPTQPSDRNEPEIPDTSTPDKPNKELEKLKQDLETAKTEMDNGRMAAVDAGAPNYDLEAWKDAESHKAGGDRNYYSTRKNENTIRANLISYNAASKNYAKATEEVRQIKEARQKEKDENKKAGDQQAAQEEAQAKSNASAAQSAMKKSEAIVSGSLTSKEASTLVGKANGRKKEGEGSFAKREYKNATDAFQKAKALYAEAAVKEGEAKKFDENLVIPDPPKSDKENIRHAEKSIQNLIGELERALESEDLNKVVSLKENKTFWAEFFKQVKDNSVRISKVKKDIQITQNTADCTFDINMDYFNKSTGRNEENSFSKIWKLEFVNGYWEVVSSKINKK